MGRRRVYLDELVSADRKTVLAKLGYPLGSEVRFDVQRGEYRPSNPKWYDAATWQYRMSNGEVLSVYFDGQGKVSGTFP